MQITRRAWRSALVLAVGMMPSCGQPGHQSPQSSKLHEAWDLPNAPGILAERFEGQFAQLPLAGRISKLPWTDSYWPNYQRGLAWRWQPLADEVDTMPNLQALQTMPQETIAKLSPAEKYDILVGNYDYFLTKQEMSRTSEDHDSWWGLCHGWAGAAVNFEEPHPVTAKNPDGIEIPFKSSDIKALLTYVQQDNRPSNAMKFLGIRCNINLDDVDDERANHDDCKGINAGSFHIVLANNLGIRNQGLSVDVERGYQVWTFPVYSYESKVIERSHDVYESAAPGTASIVTVTTSLRYISTTQPHLKPFGKHTERRFSTSRQYRYSLELDEQGRIIGGEWLVSQRPDFMWVQRRPDFRGYFARLGQLYDSSIN